MRKYITLIESNQTETLEERWFNTYQVESRNVDVFINPSKAELFRLITAYEKEHGNTRWPLRAFVTPTDLYVWDAYTATHSDMSVHKIPNAGGYLYLNKEGIFFNDLAMESSEDPEGKPYGPWIRRYYEATMTNPSIRRIYGPNPSIIGVDDEGLAGFKGEFPITAEFIEKYCE